MHAENLSTPQLLSANWLVTLRWYYAPLTVIVALLTREDVGFLNATSVLALLLGIVLVTNLFFFLGLKKAATSELSREQSRFFNVGQIGLDLCFFFVIVLMTGESAESLGHVFFILPIIASMFYFGLSGAMTVAALSGALVFLSAIVNADVAVSFATITTSSFFASELFLMLTKGGALFLAYLAIGFFGASLVRSIRSHDTRLLGEVTDMVHQLRTPLSGVKWTLKILLDEKAGKTPEEERELLTKGFEANERMVTLVNDILAVARLESGTFTYRFVPVQFEKLIEETIGSLNAIAHAKGVHMKWTAPKDALPLWSADPEKIRDVLQNLLDNAIKYTKKGGVVAVGIEIKDEKLHISVEDNGIGVPDEAKTQIFTRFFRAQNAIAAETDGSGLGLFIAQHIVLAHHGRIWFEHVLGGGTTFHVLLPKGL